MIRKSSKRIANMKQKRKMGRGKKPAKLSQVVSLFALLLVGIELLFCISASRLVEARYFPTRADETPIQVLKELIRDIVLPLKSDAQQQQTIDGLYPLQQQQHKHRSLMMSDISGLHRAAVNQQQARDRLQRRAAELAFDTGNDPNENYGQSQVLSRLVPKQID